MIRALIILVLAASVASCGAFRSDKSKGAASERALPFKAKLKKGDDKRDISISVKNNGAGLEEVRESVRFEATKYCLLNFGGSEADWTIDPATDDWAFVQDGDALTFTARCSVR